jgi:hypothetical protein
MGCDHAHILSTIYFNSWTWGLTWTWSKVGDAYGNDLVSHKHNQKDYLQMGWAIENGC